MSYRSTIAFLFAATAVATTGCPDDPPPPPRPDVPMMGDVADVMNVEDVKTPGDTAVEDVRDVPKVDDVADVSDVPADDGPTSMCGDTRFLRPMPDALLGIADDLDRDCSNGFSTNVSVSTNAPVGSMLELRVNGRVMSMARVAGSMVSFDGVMLDTGGMQTLEIWQDGIMMACATANVSVNCARPRCQITMPTRSTLNAADNATPMMPFTANFVVGTDIEDGREVELFVSNSTTPLRAAVTGGMASFRVPLSPDGTYRVRSVCTNRAGNSGMSAETTFRVDSTAPSLSVARPMMGATIGVSGDSNAMAPGVQFQVCGRSDAVGERFCAGASGAMPECVTIASATADTCVELTCPSGSAPFNVEVTATDEAMNVARTTVTGVRCQSSLPSVRVVAPAAYVATDASTVLNAMRDLNAAMPGFQTNVVACTDRPSGMASLFLNGDSMAFGAPVTVMPTAMGDPCAALGMGFVGIARFNGVTLPQTFPAPARPTDMIAENPTITVAVTDGGDTGRSTATRLFVDSQAPVAGIVTCGLVVTPGTDGSGTANIDVNSDTYPVTLNITRTGSMPRSLTLMAPSSPGGRGTFMGVRFESGVSNLTLAATDVAGNRTLTTAPCSIEVGNPPTLAFTMPMAGQVFTMTATTNITLRTDAPVGTVVTLTVGTAAPLMATVAAGGIVTFSGVRLPEGDAVVLTAVTATVPGRGVGRATVTVVVDTGVPTAPTMLAANVPTTPASARRAGTVRLTWRDGSDPAPGGGTRAVARYEVRYSTDPLNDMNFAMGTLVSTPISPNMPGAANQADITGLRLGVAYYFGMRSVDRAGTTSPTGAFAGPVTINLVRDTITDMPVSLGADVSGGYDLNGDGFRDVVVGSGITATGWAGIARVYFGSATGISATRYVEFRGSPANRFGSSVASLGDVNGDGVGDIAFGEPGPVTATALTAGAVYIFFGRRMWNAPTTPYAATDADVTIGGGTDEFATASLGVSLARVGDFNGDGVNDIAAGAPQANMSRGAVVVVFGGMALPRTITPNAANVVIRNSSTETLFGRFVAGGGRLVGGDTREDLLVGYGAASGYGFLAVFAGRAATTPASLTLTDAAFNRAGVMTPAMNTGQFVAGGVGDIDGDGRPDLAVGTGIRGPGQVSLFFGNAGGGLTTGPIIASTSMATTDIFGIRVGSIYDPTVTRPSLLVPSPSGSDLLIGAAAFGGNDPRVYIYAGRPSWTGVTTMNADRTEVFPGAASTPVSGLNWVGDVDGDGFADVAVGRASTASTLIVLR